MILIILWTAYWFLALIGLFPAAVKDRAFWPSMAAVGVFYMIQIWRTLNTSFPNSPRGYPVEPPGAWVEGDTQLEVGTMVLAQWEGQWWRAVIIGFKPEDGVLVRYVGWSETWDEVHCRTSLQLPLYGQGPPGVAVSPPAETAIRVDVRDKIE